jgi:redox-sensitive bicupin YhaK (pirin superfamily)
MIHLRKSSDRGHSQIDWLSSYHTFSFADYYDPQFMGFGNLRVINEDTVQPGKGFGRHPHNNMEIISYVVDGSLEHKDSMGTGSVITPGEIQIMSAGTGIEHSEFNHSPSSLLHFLQIWIIPKSSGLKPKYQQNTISRTENSLILIGSPEGKNGSITIQQDVNLYVAYLTPQHSIDYTFQTGRNGWLQLIKGRCDLNGQLLSAGDGAAIQHEKLCHIRCIEAAEFLLFDLAAK